MNLKKALAVISAIMLLAPVMAFGQAGNPFKQGARDFSITGSGSSDESFNNTGLAASATLGMFFIDGLQGNIRQEITFSDVNDEDAINGSTRIGLDYHFGDRRWVPFLGAAIGFVYGDNVDDDFVAGPEVGLKYMLNPTTYLVGRIEYQIFFDSDDDGRFIYGLGLGLTF